MFNADQFLQSTIADANATAVVPVPVGEYQGIIEKVDARQWTSKTDPSKSGVTLDVTWMIEDEAVKQELGRDKVTVRQGIMLDLDINGGIDTGKGKNIGLGRLREALDMNRPGEVFSFNNLAGRAARVTVTHRFGETPDDVFAEVRQVTKW